MKYEVKNIHGEGVYCKGVYPAYIKRTATKEYTLWKCMLRRCYDKAYQKIHPSYIGCEVSENFKNFQYFAEWCQSQVGFGKEGFQLDKDILIKGNKVYSEDTCCFVPKDLNVILLNRKSLRGNNPVGVYFSKKTNNFQAYIGKQNKKYHLGTFLTEEGAFMAYKKEKEQYIREVTETYKDIIDVRVYDALLEWEIGIND